MEEEKQEETKKANIVQLIWFFLFIYYLYNVIENISPTRRIPVKNQF